MATTNSLPTIHRIAASILSITLLAGCPGVPVTPAGAVASAPAASPTASPSPALPTATPRPVGNRPTPLPQTPDTSAPATIHGMVFDDRDAPLLGVTVTAEALGEGLFANGSDTLTVTTQVGTYALNGAPTGETILVTASKDGYTTRQQTIVPLANLQGDPAANRLDFGSRTGGNADAVFALSNGPEIIAVSPAEAAGNIDPDTPITLTFSEPVNTDDVEEAFAICTATRDTVLSSTGVTLLREYDTANDRFLTTGGPLLDGGELYTASDFDFEWDDDGETVTITLKEGNRLPTDKDPSRVPTVAIGFSGAIRSADDSGTRASRFFRTSWSSLGRHGHRFTLAPDTVPPRLIGIRALDDSEEAPSGIDLDAVQLIFSETMVLYPGGTDDDVSIPTDANTTANFQTLGNYALWVEPGTAPTAFDAAQVFTGDIQLDDEDPERTTVIVDSNSDTTFDPGDRIYVAVSPTVQDPAGNTVATGSGAHIRSARAI